MGGLADLSMIGSIARRIVDFTRKCTHSAFTPPGQKTENHMGGFVDLSMMGSLAAVLSGLPAKLYMDNGTVQKTTSPEKEYETTALWLTERLLLKHNTTYYYSHKQRYTSVSRSHFRYCEPAMESFLCIS